jgi:hypothetical protein
MALSGHPVAYALGLARGLVQESRLRTDFGGTATLYILGFLLFVYLRLPVLFFNNSIIWCPSKYSFLENILLILDVREMPAFGSRDLSFHVYGFPGSLICRPIAIVGCATTRERGM